MCLMIARFYLLVWQTCLACLTLLWFMDLVLLTPIFSMRRIMVRMHPANCIIGAVEVLLLCVGLHLCQL